MKVYVCWNGQAAGEHAVCASLKGARDWLAESMKRTSDSVEFDGWAWWTDSEGRVCFGECPATQLYSPPIPEGMITEFDLLG